MGPRLPHSHIKKVGHRSLLTHEAGRGHATPHMPVETTKCWWLLKIEPNAWAGGEGSCAVCVDLQAVGTLQFFGELYSLAKDFGPFFRGFRQALEKPPALRRLYRHMRSCMPSPCFAGR